MSDREPPMPEVRMPPDHFIRIPGTRIEFRCAVCLLRNWCRYDDLTVIREAIEDARFAARQRSDTGSMLALRRADRAAIAADRLDRPCRSGMNAPDVVSILIAVALAVGVVTLLILVVYGLFFEPARDALTSSEART